MADSHPSPPSPTGPPSNEDEEADADLPMTMAASVILENLPRDAHSALQKAGELENKDGSIKDKGTVPPFSWSPDPLPPLDSSTVPHPPSRLTTFQLPRLQR